MTSLTDRYVAATLRSVPAQRRDEIATELRASIEDMVEGRSTDGRDTITVERAVLTELGDPAQLAARYTDRRLQLIGPTYYLVWERLLKLLLSFVPGTVGTVVGVVEATAGGNPGGAIGVGISTALTVAVHIAFWVTLVFAVAERVNPALRLPTWNVDQLPDEPVERDVTLADTCASIVALALTLGFLVWQHFQTLIPAGGDRLPILDPALWTSWLPVLLAVLAASMGLEFAKYRARRWTWRLVVVNAVLDLAFALPVIGLLLTDRLLNPEFVQRFEWLRDGGNLDTVAGGIVVGVAAVTIWDLVDSVVKARRAAR
ncbi:HAAS signaling domain-containing protein [Micromonospora sp. NPDC049497]|uniref:HAAS signaling domain-containing protein n=1 Tax=Micromonospora sp. NPDC049497 TaxID=3364273 RepID=UPI0037A01253